MDPNIPKLTILLFLLEVGIIRNYEMENVFEQIRYYDWSKTLPKINAAIKNGK